MPVVTFPVVPDALVYKAEVTLHSGGRAGLVIRADEQGERGVAAVLDADEQTIALRMLDETDPIERRHLSVVPGTPILVRVISRSEHIEVYADERLLFQQVRHHPPTGRLGLFAQQADVTFAHPRAIHPGVG